MPEVLKLPPQIAREAISDRLSNIGFKIWPSFGEVTEIQKFTRKISRHAIYGRWCAAKLEETLFKDVFTQEELGRIASLTLLEENPRARTSTIFSFDDHESSLIKHTIMHPRPDQPHTFDPGEMGRRISHLLVSSIEESELGFDVATLDDWSTFAKQIGIGEWTTDYVFT